MISERGLLDNGLKNVLACSLSCRENHTAYNRMYIYLSLSRTTKGN